MSKFPRFLLGSLLSIGLFVGFFFSGVSAEAATATSCVAAPVIEGFRPYVYPDGDLHSFDFTVTGEGFPRAAVVMVDGRPLDPRLTTTWQTATPNSRKVHVDVPNWDGFSKDVKISVTLWSLSSQDCTTQKDFVVTLPAPKTAKFSQSTPVHVKPSTDTEKPPVKPVTPGINVAPSTKGDIDEPARPIDGIKDAVGEKDGGGPGFFQSLFASLLGNKAATAACKSWPFATWIFLAIIAIVAIVVIIDSLPYLLSGNGVRFAIALLAVFLVMLALWFLFDRCRVHRWFPIVVTLLTLGTLIMPTTLEGRGGKTKKFDF